MCYKYGNGLNALLLSPDSLKNTLSQRSNLGLGKGSASVVSCQPLACCPSTTSECDLVWK